MTENDFHQDKRMKIVHSRLQKKCNEIQQDLKKYLGFNNTSISSLSINAINKIPTYNWEEIIDLQDKMSYFDLGKRVGYETALMQLSVSYMNQGKNKDENLFLQMLSHNSLEPNFRYLNSYAEMNEEKRKDLEKYYFDNLW